MFDAGKTRMIGTQCMYRSLIKNGYDLKFTANKYSTNYTNTLDMYVSGVTEVNNNMKLIIIITSKN